MEYNVVSWVGNNNKKAHEVKTKEIWKYELQLVILFHYYSTDCDEGNILMKDIKNRGNRVWGILDLSVLFSWQFQKSKPILKQFIKNNSY